MIIDEIKTISTISELMERYEKSWKNSFNSFDLLNNIIQNSNRKLQEILIDISISRSYYYKVINVEVNPSRDTLIELLIAYRADFSDVQAVLESFNYNGLSFQVKRDLIFIYAILHKKNLMFINDVLYNQKMNLLCKEVIRKRDGWWPIVKLNATS